MQSVGSVGRNLLQWQTLGCLADQQRWCAGARRKTLQGITLLWTLLQSGHALLGGEPIAKRVIICCPTSLVSNWDSECYKWLKARAWPQASDMVSLHQYPQCPHCLRLMQPKSGILPMRMLCAAAAHAGAGADAAAERVLPRGRHQQHPRLPGPCQHVPGACCVPCQFFFRS